MSSTSATTWPFQNWLWVAISFGLVVAVGLLGFLIHVCHRRHIFRRRNKEAVLNEEEDHNPIPSTEQRMPSGQNIISMWEQRNGLIELAGRIPRYPPEAARMDVVDMGNSIPWPRTHLHHPSARTRIPTRRQRREEGLNELGEAPPPYTRKEEDLPNGEAAPTTRQSSSSLSVIFHPNPDDSSRPIPTSADVPIETDAIPSPAGYDEMAPEAASEQQQQLLAARQLLIRAQSRIRHLQQLREPEDANGPRFDPLPPSCSTVTIAAVPPP